jgi:hypothetical protein
MAKRSNSSPAKKFVRAMFAGCLAVAIVWPMALAHACPFCTAIAPSLCQLRQQAAVTALAEVESEHSAARPARSTLRVHRVLEGAERLKGTDTLNVSLDVAARPGTLLLIFGTEKQEAPAGELAWHAVAVNETSYSYFARAPSLKTATAERLHYFAGFLEHAEPLIAQDAYLEFGRAPFDEVARVADALPLARMRDWLADPRVPPDRKGFYGLALGLGGDAAMRRANAEFLKALILAPDDDFRSGFDGVLGGYLLLTGTRGLELIETRYLANAHAADGDVRHALTALRFYHEYGHDITAARQRTALRQLLKRPEFAEAAIADLARWQDWEALAQVSALYADKAFAQPAVRRAIVGYLLVCPDAKAAQTLAHLREVDPQGVAAAEEILSRTTSVPAAKQ